MGHGFQDLLAWVIDLGHGFVCQWQLMGLAGGV